MTIRCSLVGCVMSTHSSTQSSDTLQTTPPPSPYKTGDDDDASVGETLRVFVGPVIIGKSDDVPHDPRRRPTGAAAAGESRGGLFLGAFASEVVLPNLHAVNGVVHAVGGIMTFPGYKRPAKSSNRRLGQ